jgi:formate dehydrogenase
MTAERIAKAPMLKMIVTAGIGSDHTDLQAAMDRGITVAEVTYCNSNSVAEHVVMQMLSLVRSGRTTSRVCMLGRLPQVALACACCDC